MLLFINAEATAHYAPSYVISSFLFPQSSQVVGQRWSPNCGPRLWQGAGWYGVSHTSVRWL